MNNRFRQIFSHKDNLAPYLILVLLTFAVYFQSCYFDFIWDDNSIHLEQNPLLKHFTSQDLKTIWSEPYKGLYIPLSYTAWGGIKVVRLWLTGQNDYSPFLFHLANVILHIFNVCLVFRLLQFFVKAPVSCLCGALLFALHPIQVESVAWCAEFRNLLCCVFGFLSLYFYLTLTMEKRAFLLQSTYFFLALATFVLSLYSKPSSVVIPLIAAIIDFFRYRTPLARLVLKILPFALVSLPFIWITKSLQVDTHYDELAPLLVRPFIWSDAINFYLYQLLFPVNLHCPYMRSPVTLFNHTWLYLSWTVPALVTYVLFRLHKRLPEIWIGFLLFIAGFLPVSGIVPFFYQTWSTVADRYLYISMLGIALIAACAVSHLKAHQHKWVFVILAIYTLISAFIQLPKWKTPATFWTTCLSYHPETVQAYFNRGNYYAKTKQYRLALADFHTGTKSCPNADAYYNIGNIYLEQEQYEKAIEAYKRALRLNSKWGDLHQNLGLAYCYSGQLKKALACYNRSIALNMFDAEYYYNRANLFALMKNYRKAIADYSEALVHSPEKPEKIYRNRAMSWIYSERLSEAEKDIKELKRLGAPINPILMKMLQDKKKSLLKKK